MSGVVVHSEIDFFGDDGRQPGEALQLAMYIAPSPIFATDASKQGRVGLWGTPATTYDDICERFGVKPVEGPKQ